MEVDWLIVGSGFSGCVLAERIAQVKNQNVLIVEKRNHIGGNCYDFYDSNHVLVHKYGPHIFHTMHKHVWDYLSRFTDWRLYFHRVLVVIDGKTVPVPFNINSLHALMPSSMANRLEEKLIARFGYGVKLPILKLREVDDKDLKFLADFIYTKIFEGYSLKQWGQPLEQMDPEVTARIPVFISRDDHYFQDSYQGIPVHGYTSLFKRMIDHPKIRVLLNTDYRDLGNEIHYKRMIFTGPIDVFFDFQFEPLPYRSLHFEFKHEPTSVFQSVAQVNYPNEYAFTRITEFRHMTGQDCAGTTIAYEYPQPFVDGKNDAYYPVPKKENAKIFIRYQQAADELADKIVFAGRLADYRYYNMDQAVARALSVFDRQIQ